MRAQPKGTGDTKPCGAVVKYNPCTSYARGFPCPYFNKSRKCGKLPLACEMPEYDKWYKDVLDEKRKCFYPNRIRLLDNPGVPMFLFHTHHHAIMGEARIVRSSVENEKHYYWFDEFLLYPHPVQLELLQTDLRLSKTRKRGQWLFVYITAETIREIRRLSKLTEEKRKQLGEDLKRAIEQVKIFHFHRPAVRAQLFMVKESQKLKEKYELDEQILAEVQKYFSKAVEKKISRGRSLYELFYASLYLSFRMLGIPELLKDVARISDVSPTKLRKLYRLLVRKLELAVPPLDPTQLIKSRSKKLDFSPKTIRKALSLVEEARKRNVTIGHAPSSIAAVATFVACREEGEERKQEQIAEVFGVSAATIRNYYRKLEAL